MKTILTWLQPTPRDQDRDFLDYIINMIPHGIMLIVALAAVAVTFN